MSGGQNTVGFGDEWSGEPAGPPAEPGRPAEQAPAARHSAEAAPGVGRPVEPTLTGSRTVEAASEAARPAEAAFTANRPAEPSPGAGRPVEPPTTAHPVVAQASGAGRPFEPTFAAGRPVPQYPGPGGFPGPATYPGPGSYPGAPQLGVAVPYPGAAPVPGAVSPPGAVPPGRRPEPGTGQLTEDALLRNRADRPTRGWRGALYSLTGGLVNPGVGPDEVARHDLLRRVRHPLPGSHRIAVSSLKGGVGKTTVSACLGLVLAEHRGDRVVAVDANPDAGTLADRLTGETAVTVRNLLNNIDRTQSLTDVAHYTSLAGRLQVLASEQDPAMSEAFNRDEYGRICAVLGRFYNIIITDSGTGLVHSAMEGTLALADSLVVVGAPTIDGASRASKTLDWLIAHGHGRLAAAAVVVLSGDRISKEIDRERVVEHFQARCRAVVEIPFDPHLATGGRIEFRRLHPQTVDAFLELAAHLADGFGGFGAPGQSVPGPGVPQGVPWGQP